MMEWGWWSWCLHLRITPYLFPESQTTFSQAVLLATFLLPVYPKMTVISTLSAYGWPSPAVAVPGTVFSWGLQPLLPAALLAICLMPLQHLASGPSLGLHWASSPCQWGDTDSPVSPLHHQQKHRLPPHGCSTWVTQQGPGGPTAQWLHKLLQRLTTQLGPGFGWE
jgi:hypothetical protein